MKGVFLFVLLVIWGLSLKGQSLNELRAQKNNTTQKIQYTSNLLEEARKNEKATMGKLRLINSQIRNRNQLIGDINEEITVLDYYIDENAEIVDMIREDFEKLKQEYAGMIRFAQKNKNTYDKLIFLFSAENINQAYKRMLYLQQYAKYRKSQTKLMLNLADLLDKKVASLSIKKVQKQSLLVEKESETKKLVSEKSQQSKAISTLQKRQQDLKKKLREQQREQEKLNKEIERIVEEQARKTIEKAGYELTPEQKLIEADFEKNKGRLPWPVVRGVITEKFGVHSHPVLKQVQVKNNGIDITTDKNSTARAVFNGEVSRVFTVSGGNMAVIIRHGNFLSVYSNLQEVYVKPGSQVQTKQAIGLIYSDQNDGGKTVLKFQVWQENQKQNPELWISR